MTGRPNPERRAEIIHRREAGDGPRSIAKALGLSPGMVSGVLFRAGLTLPPAERAPRPPKAPRAPRERRGRSGSTQRFDHALARKLYIEGASYKEIVNQVGCAFGTVQSLVKGLPRRYDPRPRIPDDERRHIIVQCLAGVKPKDIARTLPGRDNVWVLSVKKNVFRLQPDFVDSCREEAAALRVTLRAEADRRHKTLAALKGAQEVAFKAREAEIDAHNAPIIAQLPERQRLIVAGVVLHNRTLHDVGVQFGITRERVRQIVALAVVRFGLDTGGRLNGKPGRIPSGVRRGRPTAIDPRAVPSVWEHSQ